MMINLFYLPSQSINIPLRFLIFAIEQRYILLRKLVGMIDTYILISFAACFLYYEFAKKLHASKAKRGKGCTNILTLIIIVFLLVWIGCNMLTLSLL